MFISCLVVPCRYSFVESSFCPHFADTRKVNLFLQQILCPWELGQEVRARICDCLYSSLFILQSPLVEEFLWILISQHLFHTSHPPPYVCAKAMGAQSNSSSWKSYWAKHLIGFCLHQWDVSIKGDFLWGSRKAKPHRDPLALASQATSLLRWQLPGAARGRWAQ